MSTNPQNVDLQSFFKDCDPNSEIIYSWQNSRKCDKTYLEGNIDNNCNFLLEVFLDDDNDIHLKLKKCDKNFVICQFNLVAIDQCNREPLIQTYKYNIFLPKMDPENTCDGYNLFI